MPSFTNVMKLWGGIWGGGQGDGGGGGGFAGGVEGGTQGRMWGEGFRLLDLGAESCETRGWVVSDPGFSTTFVKLGNSQIVSKSCSSACFSITDILPHSPRSIQSPNHRRQSVKHQIPILYAFSSNVVSRTRISLSNQPICILPTDGHFKIKDPAFGQQSPSGCGGEHSTSRIVAKEVSGTPILDEKHDFLLHF